MLWRERLDSFLRNGLLAPAQSGPNTGHSQELPETWGGLGCKAWFYFSWGCKGERQLSDLDLPVARKEDMLV